ncbi:MAG: cytochrome c3 family protein [Phycisphaerales bacterium]|nr:MAG: cytochrome c3 family protein [Phycisphaerales bacterium]
MKSWRITVLGVCVLMVAGTATIAAITGSSHDFSSKTWGTGEICQPCHTPHDADMTVLGAPLWNHEVTTSVFTLYSSPTFGGTATIGQPTGTSKLCLSCHDGTVALDNYGGFLGGTTFISNPFGTDLADSHPISFTYDSALATSDGGLFDPATANSGLGGTIEADLLYAGRVECSSCHDVHDDAGLASLLVMSNSGSALCLTCHDK